MTKLSQHLSDPKQEHLVMAKHVLRYLQGTVNKSLVFKPSQNPSQLIGFCDSDSVAGPDRRSVRSYTFQLELDGALLSRVSRKQQTVVLSHC